MKYLVCIIVAVMLMVTAVQAAPESAIVQEAERQLDEIDSSEWDSFINELSDEYSTLEIKPLKDTVGDIISNNGESGETIFQIIVKCFVQNVPWAIGLMIRVLILGIICGILERLQGAFGSGNVVNVARFVVFALAGIILFQIFQGAVSDAVNAVGRMMRFMEIILPILIVFLTTMGAVTSAGVIQPISAILFGTVGTAIKGIVIPVTLSGAAVSLVNKLSPNIKLDKLVELLRSVAQWVLGAIFTVYTAVLAIKGLSATSYDGVFLRTAKYAVSGLVPMIGGMLGESADLVIGCGLLVKNAIGVAGLSVIVMLVAAPCIRLLVIVLALRGCAAIMQPISGGEIPDIIGDVAGWIMMLFVSVGACGLMVFLTVSLAISMGNASMMLR